MFPEVDTLPATQHPLKVAAEATKTVRRVYARVGLLAVLLPLAYVPFHFEQIAFGWAAFVTLIVVAAALAESVAKWLFSPFDSTFERVTGLNYTAAVSGVPATRERMMKLESFLDHYGGPTVSRRAARASAVCTALAVGFGLLFTILTVQDYRARLTQPIELVLPKGFEHLREQIAQTEPVKPEETMLPGSPPSKTESPIDPEKGANVLTKIVAETMPNVIRAQKSLARAKEAIEGVKKNPAQAATAMEPLKEAIADLKELARDETLPPDARERIAQTAEDAEDVLHSMEELAKDPSDKTKHEDFVDKAQSFIEKLIKFIEFLLDIYEKLSSISEQVFGDKAGSSSKTKESAKGGKEAGKGGTESKGSKEGEAKGAKADPSRATRIKQSLQRDLTHGTGHTVTAQTNPKPGSMGDAPPPTGSSGRPVQVDAKDGPQRKGKLGDAKTKAQFQSKDKGATPFGSSVPK